MDCFARADRVVKRRRLKAAVVGRALGFKTEEIQAAQVEMAFAASPFIASVCLVHIDGTIGRVLLAKRVAGAGGAEDIGAPKGEFAAVACRSSVAVCLLQPD